jgi:hypothetical protein
MCFLIDEWRLNMDYTNEFIEKYEREENYQGRIIGL